MYICFAYTYTLILLLIGYSGCSDKPTNTQGSNSNEDNLPQIGGISLVDYSDSDDEDNFQVTETQEEQTEEITEVLDETHTEETSETDVLDETQPEPETTQIETQPELETTQVLTETETQTEPVKDVETQTDLQQPEPQTEHPRPIQPTRYYLIEPQFQYPGYHSIYYYPPYQTPTPQYGPYGPQPQPIPYDQYPPIQPVPIHHPYGTPPQYYPGYLIEPITIQQPIPHIQQQQGYQPQPQAYYPVPQPEPSQTESSKVSTPKQPTEPATEKSEQQTQSEPSKETTEEATQPTHTQPTQEPEQLRPETIPVEVGSDDEEEPPKEPSGPGDGDQSPDKPEEEEEEEDEEELLCKEIKFLKKDAVGSLVELTKEECKIILNNIFKVKYHVNANVEQVLCDGKIIYEHRPEKPYFQTLLYNKKNNAFVVTRPYGFLLIKNISGEWVTKRGRKIPEYIKFFRQGSVGREVEIHDRNYWIEFTSLEGFRFTFKKGVYCTKVQVANQVIWVKKFGEDHPFSVTFTAREKVIILFNGYIRIFSKGRGLYRHILTRTPHGYYQD
ncbi:Theileria-specific sub-telomeric protein, SVSP family member, putative [Theileria annulata]|uniref:Theileria-specific sub-telomeric protein, SVSP family member, putative n=1 Tax=Theileria annulata TaxID=5874 RepID=Q4U8D5_THEAN|nr:Theileria-specific sub-telomeric protein, SVSP family member, putative [Theileria annulata]CAI76918.1 Theileria-specific sub-telomeric protein, SVSP family member, putative [Theileria annulata]|eukprot:XP_953543.1 Theileria-specific sub-telomeric protein, SVSP family member, putative [Theileria annulata]